MRFSRDWLAQYVELPAEPDALATGLTDIGLAVDDLELVPRAEGGHDALLEVDVTTNRPDCMCHLGLAREASLRFERPLRPPEVAAAESDEPVERAASLTVEDPARCPRFVGLVLRGVVVGPSPAWLRSRIEAIGLRAINNIVDITNYVLWECGQPLHAYDLARLSGPEIRVRQARDGETLVTLDDETRHLTPEVMVIADAERATGLAGIMGGLDSEVTATTTDVFLEAAHFDPRTVRRGARLLGMHTDASHRFERGADPGACLWAARRAAALILELGGGRLLAGALDAHTPRPEWPPTVPLDLARLNCFAGLDYQTAEVERILGGLGFELEPRGPQAWTVTVPSWRYYDFTQAYPADVYEEVMRVHGVNEIPSTLPAIAGIDRPQSPRQRCERLVRDHLAACGFAEAINFAFHDRDTDASTPSLYGDRPPLALANPLSDRYAVLRRSLLPGLVASARYNQRRGATAVRLFELGHIFATTDGGEEGEKASVALVAGGQLGTPWERPFSFDFYDLKGILESLAVSVGLSLVLRPVEQPGMVPGTAAEITAADQLQRVIGFIGVLDASDLAYPLCAAELEIDGLLRPASGLETQPPSRFPGIEVDSTLTHSLEVPWEAITQAIDACQVEDLVAYGLKDRYRGEGVAEGMVNTTLYFHYNADERSLTHEEVNARHAALAAKLERRFAGA